MALIDPRPGDWVGDDGRTYRTVLVNGTTPTWKNNDTTAAERRFEYSSDEGTAVPVDHTYRPDPNTGGYDGNPWAEPMRTTARPAANLEPTFKPAGNTLDEDVAIDRISRTLDRMEMEFAGAIEDLREAQDATQQTLNDHVIRYETTRSKSWAERLGLTNTQLVSFLIAIASAVGVAVDATTSGGFIGG